MFFMLIPLTGGGMVGCGALAPDAILIIMSQWWGFITVTPWLLPPLPSADIQIPANH